LLERDVSEWFTAGTPFASSRLSCRGNLSPCRSLLAETGGEMRLIIARVLPHYPSPDGAGRGGWGIVSDRDQLALIGCRLPVGQRRQLVADATEVREVEIGGDRGFAIGRVSEDRSPGVDDQ
jgi:hypothetical protein